MLKVKKISDSEVNNLMSKLKELTIYSDTNISKVLCILNMILVEELEEDSSYKAIFNKVIIEAKKYGKIINLKIPRPSNSSSTPGLGKVFIEYTTKEGAKFAKENLEKLKWQSKPLVIYYFSEEKFKKGYIE